MNELVIISRNSKCGLPPYPPVDRGSVLGAGEDKLVATGFTRDYYVLCMAYCLEYSNLVFFVRARVLYSITVEVDKTCKMPAMQIEI